MKSTLLRRSHLTFLAILAFTTITLSACSWFDTTDKAGTDTSQDQNANYGPLKTPEKIEGLYVGTCKELFDDMRKSDKAASDDELYRAAAVIIASDRGLEEANECCNNITDESLKEACKK